MQRHGHSINPKKKPQKLIETLYTRSSKEPSSSFEENFQFQVWNKENTLILHSRNPHFKGNYKIQKTGFSEIINNNKKWRVYTLYNKNLGLTISVAEDNAFRQSIQKNIIRNNLIVVIFASPILALLIWLTVGFGLSSLRRIARALLNRNEADFSPFHFKDVPIEIQPLVKELNNLFSRLQQAFERNKRFAADAAHELRTPLAALKTQTEVALLSKTEEERGKVLKKLNLSVDRCTHVVQQLLTLSRLGQENTLYDMQIADFYSIAPEIIAEIAPLALAKQIEIELIQPEKHIKVFGNETAIGVLLRNLVDNAIRYTPEHGNILVEIEENDKTVILRVTDDGPGIPPELRVQVFERFYRILGNKAHGSGLGLAIVQQIAEIHNAKIKLGTPKIGKGLEVEVIFPKM